MLLKTMPTFPADAFEWDSKNPTEEASTLTAGRSNRLYGYLYDDAADVGFGLHNAKTGVTTYWYLEDTHADREGDVTHWTFKAAPESVRKFAKLAAYTLTVWND